MAKIETERYITTVSGKRYKLGVEGNPQLWSVELSVAAMDQNTGHHRHDAGRDLRERVFVERTVLEDHGLVPRKKEPDKPAEEPLKTAEDLLLELLEHVGVYPAE